MDALRSHRVSPWRLSRLELAGALVGAATGLIAAAPLLWLAVEAHRTDDVSLSAAARFQPWELIVIWGGGAIVGGYLAALLTRLLLRVQEASVRPLRWSQHVLHLLAGAVAIMLVAAAPAAGLLALLNPHPGAFIALYLVAGGLVGWQSGVIALVFLYTFQTLDQIRRNKERNP
jgi:hypothetical protein